MAKTKPTPFQLDLLQQKEDKAGIERVHKLHQRIFTLAEQSERERRRRVKFAMSSKLARKQQTSLDKNELDDHQRLQNRDSNRLTFKHLWLLRSSRWFYHRAFDRALS